MAGFLGALVAQFIIVATGFRDSLLTGLLCLLIPGYVLFHAMREETRQPKPLGFWACGIALIIAGVMLGA